MEKLKEAEPKRTRLTGEQVQALLRAAEPHRVLLATAIMARGLRISELTNLRWRDLNLRDGLLTVAASKTPAGVRQVVLEPELVQLLREHKGAAEWTEPDDFVFAGRIREKPRERNTVRTRILYAAVERASKQLFAEGSRRCLTASRSTHCAIPTLPCAPSWASILRSPLPKWATATLACPCASIPTLRE